MWRIQSGLAAIFLTVTAVSGLCADSPKFSATVVLDKIDLRAGQSWQFPKVGELKKGEQVLVHHEDDHWVAIYPPPGSVSWVQARFLDRIDPNLAKQNVEIKIDPSLKAEVHVVPPTAPKEINRIYQVKLPRGSIVEVIGPPVKDENTTWYPITPPEGEYRWIPKQAIGTPSPAAPAPEFVRTDGQGAKSTVVLRGDPKNPPEGANKFTGAWPPPQWLEAEQAEQAGKYPQAERAYTQIYQDLRKQNADPELVLVCYNRIVKCRERMQLDGTGARTNPPIPGPMSGGTPPATLLTPTPSTGGTSLSSWPTGGGTSNAVTGNGPRWSGVGMLRRAGFQIDDRPSFALLDSRGKIICYATAATGIDLERSVNQSIELYGRMQTRGDIRGGPHMVVTQVR